MHDQLPLNSPRAGRQQEQEVVAVRCIKLTLFLQKGQATTSYPQSAFADSPEGHTAYISLRPATPFLRYTPSIRRGSPCRLVALFKGQASTSPPVGSVY